MTANRREFLERSIADLDEEHAAGDLSDEDHARLRGDYERRLAALDSPKPKRKPPAAAATAGAGSRGRRLATLAIVLVVAIGAGVLLAGAVGRRGAGDNVTGIDLSIDDVTTSTTAPLDTALRACIDEEDASLAVGCFIEYTRAHPQDPVGFFRFGVFAINQGMQADRQELLSGGEEFLRTAIDLDPGYAEARVFLATYLARTDRVDEAREVLAPLEGAELPAELQELVDAIEPLLTTTTVAG